MEFDEMQKIWNQNNIEDMFKINESALHKNIVSKKEKASKWTNINDFGLIAVSIITAIIYVLSTVLNEQMNVYDYLIVVTLICISVYVWIGRLKRMKEARRFDRSLLGDLDHAILSVDYEVRRSKTMVWWFLLPLAVLVMLNMSTVEVSIWKWLGIAGGFIFSHFLIRWEHNRCHKPKKKKLEALREQLVKSV